MDIDIKKIKELAELTKANELAKIKVTDGDKSVVIEAATEQQTIVQTAAAPMAPGPVAPQASDSSLAAPTPSASGKEITAPMVGTFYAAPSPDAPPFVKVGDAVKKGQTLCIIEAMKLMNELESDADGTITEVCLTNGEPVEFGQVLFHVG